MVRDDRLTSAMIINPEQQKAITLTSGPLLIIAGAGTGKTTVIVEKIKHLIFNKLAQPENILALTFTEKAAFEMEERVDKEMPYGYFQMWISTFHSFADQILRDEISHIGLSPGYRLLTQAETILFLKNSLFLFDLKYFRPLGNPHKFLYALYQHFSRLKDEDISPEEYLRWAEKEQKKTSLSKEEKEKTLELAAAYKTYQELKIKESYFDFSDLIFYLLKLFRERPALLKKYRQQFHYVLVDEFQDTNIAQYLLIKLLCSPDKNPNLTVVGDDSQAIYKFRGASVSNILAFMKDYPQASQVTLSINYRSFQSILDASHKLIQNNNPDTLEIKLGISKKLKANRGDKRETIDFSLCSNINEETEFVAQKILSARQKNNYKYSDFALLIRANNHAEPFINTFLRQGIPYYFFGPGMLFKQPEVKDLIAYLKILYSLDDSVSLYRVLMMDVFNLNTKDISLLLSLSKRISRSLFITIEICLSFFEKDLYRKDYEIYKTFIPLLHEESKIKLLQIYRIITKHLSLIKKYSAGHILYFFLEDTEYIKEFTSYKTTKEEKIVLNITKFFEKLKTFESTHDDASVFTVVDYLDMSLEIGESPLAAETDAVNYDAVNILTIHSAKGLEFPVVFLINLSKGRFPTYEQKEPLPISNEFIKEILPEGDYHLQEERRLFYVGLTRAKDMLYLTASKTYSEAGRERKLSPFVIETLGDEIIRKKEMVKKEEKAQLSIFDFKKPEEILIKENVQLTNFSFTQLETFAACPLQYKYQYLLKIPTTPSSAMTFGDTLHKTLQRFYQEYLGDTSLALPRLIDIYHLSWIPVGYTSKSHEEQIKKGGEILLTNFFKTFHTPDIPIRSLEKLFKIKVYDNTFVTGKIDRIDEFPDGTIEIIDYKTGRKPPDEELKKSLQLSIYALAATHKSFLGKKVDQVKLTFYYLQEMNKVSMQRTAQEIQEVQEHIITSGNQMRNNVFHPKVGPWCSFCSYRMICEAWR